VETISGVSQRDAERAGGLEEQIGFLRLCEGKVVGKIREFRWM